MPYSVEGKLVVAISSRALFDFEEENRVFDRDGDQREKDRVLDEADVRLHRPEAVRVQAARGGDRAGEPQHGERHERQRLARTVPALFEN